MSQAFLIEVSDDKDGVCYPSIIGPFPNDDAAREFAEKFRLGEDWGGEGGYHDYHVVSESTCTAPEKYAEDYAWVLADG